MLWGNSPGWTMTQCPRHPGEGGTRGYHWGRRGSQEDLDLAVHPHHQRERCQTCRRSENTPIVFFLSLFALFRLNGVQRRRVSVLFTRGDWHLVRSFKVCGVWTPPPFKAGCTTNTLVDRILQHECKWMRFFNIAALFICTVALKPHSSANEVIIIKEYKYLSRFSVDSMDKPLLYNLFISHNANGKCWWGWAYLHLPKGTDHSHPGHVEMCTEHDPAHKLSFSVHSTKATKLATNKCLMI